MSRLFSATVLSSFTFVVTLQLLLIGSAWADRVSRHDDTASGLQGWVIRDNNIEIQLNPLTLDQVRAFYLGRDFSDKVVDEIQQSCVFQAVVTNVSDPTSETKEAKVVNNNLADWEIIVKGKTQALQSKEAWIAHWAALGASPSAQLAFRWATFPFEQDFHPGGDYGWGMIFFGLKPGSQFDLLSQWHVGKQADQQLIKGIQCPS